MRRRLRLALPSLASGGSRALQLGVLFVLLATAVPGERATLVAGFGVLSAFAIFTDSGASPYLLQTAPDRLGRAVHVRATLFHLGLSAAGATAALAIVAVSPGSQVGSWVVLAALAVSGVGDSVMRTTRAPLLVQRRDAAFATPEAALVAVKAPFLLWALLAGSPSPLIGLAPVSVAVLVVTFLRVRRGLMIGGVLPRRLYAHILEFGVSGSLSSLYSQAPLVVGTLILGVGPAEPLAVAYRLVQPLEFLPATVAAQLMPRLRAGDARTAPWLAVFAGSGAVVAVTTILLLPALDALAGGAIVASVYVVVAASAVPKFANYLLVAVAMARGFILQRLLATAVVAVVAVTASVLAAVFAGAVAIAWVTVGCELLLFALLGTLLMTAMHRSAVTVGREVAA